jgi:ATP-dependent DNA ligase
MKSFVNALKICESTNGTGSDAIKQEAIGNLSEDGKRLMVEMFSIFRVFGVKKYDAPTEYAITDESAIVFFKLLDNLHERHLTGNAARTAVTNALSQYTEETAKYLARVLDKDAKAGFSESTVNKVFPGLVPVFKAMKGEKIEDKKKKGKDGKITTEPFDFKKKIGFPCRVEIKHDGLRSIVFSGNPVLYFSYEGRLQEQWNGLFDDEVNALATAHGGPIIVDAEVEGNNFLETIRAKKAGNDLGKDNLRLKVFDILTREEWDTETCARKQNERSDYVTTLLNKTNPTKIVQTHFAICKDLEELKTFHAKAVEDGYEGTMVKVIDGVYEWKRSKFWFKWKPVITVDLEIVDFYEGKKGTKNEGTLGGLVLKGTDENGQKIKTDCGGFKVRGGLLDDWMMSIGIDLKDNDVISQVRDYIWNHKAEFIGKIVEIEGQELTLAEGETELYSIRFPQVKLFRTDKDYAKK